MNVKDLQAIVAFMKTNGILKLKEDTLVIELSPTAFQLPPQAVDPDVFATPVEQSPASEEEVRFFSAGGAGVENADGSPFQLPFLGDTNG